MSPDNNIEQKPRFYIDKDCNWYQDGIKIRHRRTYLYNNKLLDRDSDGNYFLDEGSGRMYIEVEDTPFVVRMVYRRNGTLYIRLNDETEEVLDPNLLVLNSENVPYTKVKSQRFDARFMRPAYYELMKQLEEDDGEYYLTIKDVSYPIKRSSKTKP